MSIRDLRDRSRRSLHTALAVAAVCVDLDTEEATACSVRVHHRTQAFGDMAGFDYAPAERVTTVPEIVVLAEEVTPKRGMVFSLAADEAYEVETVMPRNGITVTTQVTRMSQAKIDAANLPLPEASA